MFRLAAGAIVALLFSGPAFAQTAPYDWAGFYIGANGGYGWGIDDEVEFNYDPACVILADCPASVTLDTEGFLAGGHLGANWQHNMWVFGIEGDADWSDISGSGTVTSGLTTVSASTELEWLATLRGRAGIAADRALLYITGGLAFGEVDNRATLTSVSTAIPGLSGSPWSGSESDIEFGWVVGGGFEFAATQNLILGVEAMYVDLGENSVNLERAPPVTPPDITADFENDFVIARGRITWKW